jgi:hypothetical protein
MDIIKDFRHKTLTSVSDILTETLSMDREGCNQKIEDLNSHPEKLEDEELRFLYAHYTRTQQSIIAITEPQMNKVWLKVANLLLNESDDKMDFFMKQRGYLNNILSALSGGSYWEKLPQAQRNKEYDELVKSLKDVAATLNKVDYLEPALGFMDDRKYSDLQFNLFDTWIEFTKRNSVFFYKIPELLNRYAELLQTEQRHKNILIDRPNGDDACVSYFARSLYTDHKRDFGTPLYETISTIAGIFYPDHDTSSEKIRASIRAMK